MAGTDGGARPGEVLLDLAVTLVVGGDCLADIAVLRAEPFGHYPLWAFVDHRGTGDTAGTGEPLAVLLRPGNAGSNTAVDHITVIPYALRQLPDHRAGTRPWAQGPGPFRLGRRHP